MNNSNFSNILISIITLSYLVITTLIIRDSYFSSVVVKDISMITTSFFTLIIAILLYDRFNYRKIIFEKKLELVLKLLENLKQTRFQFSYEKKDDKYAAGHININKTEIHYFQNHQHINPKALVIFNMNIRTYSNQIRILKNNPYMPKEIVQSLNFLDFNILQKVDNNPIYKKEFIKLNISLCSEHLNNEDNLKPEKDITFYDFINHYLISLNLIETWINKHSNFKADLNI